MPITQCLHTAILMTDLAKAEEFYRNILGLSKAKERPLKFSGSWYQIGAYQIHLIVNPEFTNQILNPDKWGRNLSIDIFSNISLWTLQNSLFYSTNRIANS